MDTVMDVADSIDEHLRKQGFATEFMVHPSDEKGAIIGARGGDLSFSVVVQPAQ